MRREDCEVLTCRRFVAGLNDYLDDDLDGAIRGEFDRHASGCPRCRIIAETTRKTIELYRTFLPGEVPTAVEARLFTAIRTKMP
jgi:anti-sigma factor RsiW